MLLEEGFATMHAAIPQAPRMPTLESLVSSMPLMDMNLTAMLELTAGANSTAASVIAAAAATHATPVIPSPAPPAKQPKAPTRKWTDEEDKSLEKAVRENQGRNWKLIAESLPGRTEVASAASPSLRPSGS